MSTEEAKAKARAYSKLHYQRNKAYYNEKTRKWQKLNPEKKRRSGVKSQLKRYRTNVKVRIGGVIRSRISCALKRGFVKKSSTTYGLIGCSVEQLKSHIESLFVTGMSWENYGMFTWHIDHIIPCAAFDFTDPEQQKKCFHYTNLQPLWAKDNLSKSDKY